MLFLRSNPFKWSPGWPVSASQAKGLQQCANTLALYLFFSLKKHFPWTSWGQWCWSVIRALGRLRLEDDWTTQRVQGQPEIQSEALLQKTKNPLNSFFNEKQAKNTHAGSLQSQDNSKITAITQQGWVRWHEPIIPKFERLRQ